MKALLHIWLLQYNFGFKYLDAHDDEATVPAMSSKHKGKSLYHLLITKIKHLGTLHNLPRLAVRVLTCHLGPNESPSLVNP